MQKHLAVCKLQKSVQAAWYVLLAMMVNMVWALTQVGEKMATYRGGLWDGERDRDLPRSRLKDRFRTVSDVYSDIIMGGEIPFRLSSCTARSLKPCKSHAERGFVCVCMWRFLKSIKLVSMNCRCGKTPMKDKRPNLCETCPFIFPCDWTPDEGPPLLQDHSFLGILGWS